MDYEKKYKKALKAAAVVHKDLERIFPELKESKDSEDEQIRKEIIDFIYDKTDTYELIEKSNSWLTWLDKQGLRNPADEPSTFKDKLLELFQRFRWYCKDKTPTNGDIIEYVDAHIQELIDALQNKPWSEEDEANINEALSYIKDDALKEFIKSLRLQKQWKPSGELDEASYQVGIKRVLENPESYGLTKCDWKPSDEQMTALKEVIDVGYFTSCPNALEILYEQLKQL